MQTVSVSLGARSYSIVIGPRLMASLGARCAELGLGKRCALITDTNVGQRYADTCVKSLKKAGFDAVVITVPAGEKSKSMSQVAKAYDLLSTHRLERKSFVVALGGGVVGDLAGFVAATYLRGIPFVQIPTSLLAQVDSSVGGKVGVNLKSGKNLVGAFHQPKLVLCDLATLKTLPEREFRAGLAEVIKYGIIYDAPFFASLEKDLAKILKRQPQLLEKVIARCCEIKADVVSQDETETGLRAILNFGHTIGHGIEAVFRYGEYLHGEAISIGQVAAAELSSEQTGFPASDAQRIEKLFARTGLPTRLNFSAKQWEKLVNAMRLDKKVSAGEIKFVLASAIGQVSWGNAVPIGSIAKVLQVKIPGRA